VQRPGAHVRAKYLHATAGHVIQARQQRYQRGFARARTADDAQRSANGQLQGDIVQRICRGGAVAKTHVVKTQRRHRGGLERARGERNRGGSGIRDGRLARQHLVDTRRTGACLGKDHHHIGHVHNREQRLGHVVHKRDHLALGKVAHVHRRAAAPQNGAHPQVHDQKGHGIKHARQLAHRDGGLRLVGSGGGETLALVLLAGERANHADAGKPFALHQANVVELCLHALKIRHALSHDQPEHHGDKRGGHQKDQPQADIDQQRGRHGAHRQERPANQHAYSHGNGQLHLVDVVGDAGDEGRRAKAIKVRKGQTVDVRIKLAAHVRTHTLRRQRGHLLANQRDRDAHHGHRHQHQPVAHHRIHVARAHAVVDHACHHQRRNKVKARLYQLGQGPYDEIPAVRAGKTPQQVQHQTPRCSLEFTDPSMICQRAGTHPVKHGARALETNEKRITLTRVPYPQTRRHAQRGRHVQSVSHRQRQAQNARPSYVG